MFICTGTSYLFADFRFGSDDYFFVRFSENPEIRYQPPTDNNPSLLDELGKLRQGYENQDVFSRTGS